MHGGLCGEDLQFQERIGSYIYNGQWSTGTGQRSSGTRYARVMRARSSQEHIKSKGLQGKLDFQRSFTQAVSLSNTRGILDGCFGAQEVESTAKD